MTIDLVNHEKYGCTSHVFENIWSTLTHVAPEKPKTQIAHPPVVIKV